MSESNKPLEEKTTIQVDVNDPLKEKTTIQVDVIDRDAAEKRLFHRFHAKGHRECYKSMVRFCCDNTNDEGLRQYATTRHIELASKILCQYRFLTDGRYYCKRKGIRRFIISIRECEVCPFRLSSSESFQKRLAIEEKMPFVNSKRLDLQDRVTDKKRMEVMMDGAGYYPSCQFTTQSRKIGDVVEEEIKSGECPKDSGLRYQYHPVYACAECRCHMLRKSPKIKKVSQST